MFLFNCSSRKLMSFNLFKNLFFIFLFHETLFENQVQYSCPWFLTSARVILIKTIVIFLRPLFLDVAHFSLWYNYNKISSRCLNVWSWLHKGWESDEHLFQLVIKLCVFYKVHHEVEQSKENMFRVLLSWILDPTVTKLVVL